MTAMAPLTSEPPPRPRPTWTFMWSKGSIASAPAPFRTGMDVGMPRIDAKGSSVWSWNQTDRALGCVIEVKTLPPSAGAVRQSIPISMRSALWPASARRRAATAPPYPEPMMAIRCPPAARAGPAAVSAAPPTAAPGVNDG